MKPAMLRAAILRFALFIVLVASFLFLVAGRWDLPMFWAFLIVFFGVAAVGWVFVHRSDPSLLQERLKPTERGLDPYTRPLAAASLLACFTISSLDVGRSHWSAVPFPVQILALVVIAVSLAVWMWAMASNRFFSAAVRIQHDRGHQVVTTGPYRFVRHPGYAVALLLFPAIPIALGAWWGVLPMLVLDAVFIWRASLEDRMLLSELSGYAGFAAEVRYRLIPGVW